MKQETLDEKISRLMSESTSLKDYDPSYPKVFEKEKSYLLEVCPTGIISRIEHFGSTAIPGIRSKPVVDLLVEVNSLEEVKEKIVPVLEDIGYEYLWRPATGKDSSWYAWFIKRNYTGERTHHIHMIEADFAMWERLLFRDYLKEFPVKARLYSEIKEKASISFPNDRVKYTEAKGDVVRVLTEEAKVYYQNKNIGGSDD